MTDRGWKNGDCELSKIDIFEINKEEDNITVSIRDIFSNYTNYS
jgi:hypothetical protein